MEVICGDWRNRILVGDVREQLRTLPERCVHSAVTSPPYWGPRDYGVAGQLGNEPTPEEYVSNMVEVFREVWRVLRDDGVLMLNLGDTYSGSSMTGGNNGFNAQGGENGYKQKRQFKRGVCTTGLKPKDLVGIPWAVATALRAPYYTGKIAHERDRAWLAAMIDGEGTICGFHHVRADDGRPRTGIHVAITNSSQALLDEASRIWPASRSEHDIPGDGHLGKRTTWRWIVHGIENKTLLLRELYPYLIEKKRQAMVAYNLLLLMADAKSLGHSPQRDSIRDKRKVLTDLISAINHRASVDMPSWLVEPPSVFEPGWYLRSDIIWHKPNCMPSSVRDRPTTAHEYVFLLTKSARYFWDAEAVAEPASHPGDQGFLRGPIEVQQSHVSWRAESQMNRKRNGIDSRTAGSEKRNIRSVWRIPSHSFKGAHFATFPPRLAETCIKATTSEHGCCPTCGKAWVRVTEKLRVPTRPGTGSKVYVDPENSPYEQHSGTIVGNRDPQRHCTATRTTGWKQACKCETADPVPCVVLDPFMGAGTVGLMAEYLGRDWVGTELNPEYAAMATGRIKAGYTPPKTPTKKRVTNKRQYTLQFAELPL